MWQLIEASPIENCISQNWLEGKLERALIGLDVLLLNNYFVWCDEVRSCRKLGGTSSSHFYKGKRKLTLCNRLQNLG